MEKKIIYNMSKANKITFDEQPDETFRIKIFFDQQSVIFIYEDKTKAEEVLNALSQFKGNIVQIGNELIINLGNVL